MSSWYSLVNAGKPPIVIMQGDLLENFPVLALDLEDEKSSLSYMKLGEDPPLTINYKDLIVLSQSCDLARPKPDDRVIICPRYDFSLISKQKSENSNNYWGKLKKNRIIGEYLLNKCEISNHETDYQVVNFREVYSVEYLSIQEHLEESDEYIRLNSPFREHLSQSFGLLFSRIGLPSEFPNSYQR
jgi:hypothetical protein